MPPETSTLTSRAKGWSCGPPLWGPLISEQSAFLPHPQQASGGRTGPPSPGSFLKHSCVSLAPPFGPCGGVETQEGQ